MMTTSRNSPPALIFRDVSYAVPVPGRHGDGPVHHILGTVNLSVARGDIACIVGPSGCGKTTLLNLAAGFLAPTRGRVHAHGKRVAGPEVDRAVMFQEDALFPWLSVRNNIAFGPRCQGNIDRLGEVDRMIELVGLSGFGDYFPDELSGGMRQRVALARALINRADILLLDEPFASLDAQARESMQELLLSIHERLQPAILMVTHDIEEAVFLGDRIMVLHPHGTGSRLQASLETGLERPRTHEMREDPRLAAWRRRLRGLLRGDTGNP